MLTVNQLLIATCLYAVLESLHPIVRMPGGLVLMCHKLKYIFIAAAATVSAYDLCYVPYTSKDIFVVLALALAVWPRMLWRLKRSNIWAWFCYVLTQGKSYDQRQ